MPPFRRLVARIDTNQTDEPRREVFAAIVAGTAAGALATGGTLALAEAVGRPSLAEFVAEAIAAVTPLEIIERMIALLGPDAKHLLFVAVLIGQTAIGAAFGLVAGRGGWARPRIVAHLTALVAATGFIVLPLLGAGVLGSNTRAGVIVTLLGLVVAELVYLGVYALAWRYLHPGGFFAREEAAARRKFLKNSAIALAGLTSTAVGFRWLAEKLEPPPVGAGPSIEAAQTTALIASEPSLVDAITRGIPGLAPEITPNEKFYVVSKNFFRDPDVSADMWRLEIIGSVDQPAVLTYDEMKTLPSNSQYLTLQCISNEVGGNLMGNALWRGASLADILRRVRVRPGAVDVILHAVDGYTDSIPIAKAMQSDTMLAYEMNGEVLPKIHGFPVRLLVPDIYGMKNVKWVNKIEVVDYDYKGYWMTKGWSDVATMHTTSRIDIPKPSSFLRPGTTYVGGVAIAGQRGIKMIEVSTDGGISWGLATVKPPLGPLAWTQWLYAWEMPGGPAAAEESILVRATDGSGMVQTAAVRDTLPDGATGYHTITVRSAAT